MGWIPEELVLSGTHQCISENNGQFLTAETWILGTVWEILVLCLAVWIVVKRCRELRQSSTGWAIGDCFTVLITTHVLYFAR